MERPSQCNADECVCADGRESDTPKNELIICETCGSNCIHKNCWQRSEPYFCCFPIDIKVDTESHPQPTTNNGNITTRSSETIVNIRTKRKRAHQTDDEKIDEKNRKKLKIERCREYSLRKSKGNFDCSSKMTTTKVDTKINSNFPITTIRNGTFDQILRFTPRVLLYPLSLENLNISSKTVDDASQSNRSLITSNFRNNFVKKELQSSDFAFISPTKKKNGKTFKNFMITAFFKPHK